MLNVMHIVGHALAPGTGIASAVPPLVAAQGASGGASACLVFAGPAPAGGRDGPFPVYALAEYGNLERLFAVAGVPDIVVFHEVYFFPFLGIARKLRAMSIPYVVTPHCSLTAGAQKQKRWAKLALNALFFADFIRGARAISYLNEAERAASVYDAPPPIYVNNGITPPEATDADGKALEPVRIVFLSRIDFNHKGVDLLLDAVRTFGRSAFEEERFELVLYGPGEAAMVDRLRKEVQALGHAFVRYEGPVFGDAKAEALRNGHLFVLPSRFEGMPMAVLEAWSYGLPCIVTPQTNMAEWVVPHDAGWVAEPHPAALAETMLAAVRTYRNDRDGYRNRSARLAERFDWRRIAASAIAQYRGLLE